MSDKSTTAEATEAGVGAGFVIAAVMSWTKVHSILWMMFHGALGWFYIIYHVVNKDY